MRFGLKDVNELPSMEEFEKLVAESFQAELIPAESAAQTESASSEPARSNAIASDEDEAASAAPKTSDGQDNGSSEQEAIEKSAAAREE